jgi:hypothetical protein
MLRNLFSPLDWWCCLRSPLGNVGSGHEICRHAQEAADQLRCYRACKRALYRGSAQHQE